MEKDGQSLLEILLACRTPSELHRREEALLREGHAAADIRAAKEAVLALAALSPEPSPPSALRDRLTQSMTRKGRFGVFADRIARLYDLPVEKAAEVLQRLEDPDAWKAGFVPDMLVIPVRPGPSIPPGIAGFGKLTPGMTFPHHDHVGEETTIVLQGGFRDGESDLEIWRGDELWKPAGSDHEFLVLPGDPCIAAVLSIGGVSFR